MVSEVITMGEENAGVQVQSTGIKSRDWQNLNRRARYHKRSTLKQYLIDWLKRFMVREGIKNNKYDYVLSIHLGCGGSARYKTWDDIPNESVPCPCGNPKHWLIRYTDLRQVSNL